MRWQVLIKDTQNKIIIVSQPQWKRTIEEYFVAISKLNKLNLVIIIKHISL